MEGTMSHRIIADSTTTQDHCDQPKLVQGQAKLYQGPISRRGVLTGLLATAGGGSAWDLISIKEAKAQSSFLDPEWTSMLQTAQANSRNIAVLIKPGKGLVATFGDNLFQRLPDSTFSLFVGQTKILSGVSTKTFTGNRNSFQTGNRLTEVDIIQSSDNKSVRMETNIQMIDSSGDFYQINVSLGPTDGP